MVSKFPVFIRARSEGRSLPDDALSDINTLVDAAGGRIVWLLAPARGANEYHRYEIRMEFNDSWSHLDVRDPEFADDFAHSLAFAKADHEEFLAELDVDYE